MAMTLRAPEMTAPCSAESPMPPTPTITTVSPGWTSAMLVADPNPVGTAQPRIAAVSNRPEALEAGLALTAGGDERQDDVVAFLQAGDVAADLGDDARALVAAECGQGDRGGAGGQVVIGVAHARRVHADLHLVVDGVADLD